MVIGGFQKFSLLDYPGKMSAVIFLSGCNFRCGFCHNPELVDPLQMQDHPSIDPDEVYRFLETRQGKLDGVCITGGEPTIWQKLPEMIAKIKDMGFLLKLDTNGTNPQMVKNLIESKLVDYFAIDIKSSPEKYSQTISREVKISDIEETLKSIVKAGIYLELRTTIAPVLVTLKDIELIKKWLLNLKIADKIGLYALQQFRPGKNLKEEFHNVSPYDEKELRNMAGILSPFIGKVEVRGV